MEQYLLPSQNLVMTLTVFSYKQQRNVITPDKITAEISSDIKSFKKINQCAIVFNIKSNDKKSKSELKKIFKNIIFQQNKKIEFIHKEKEKIYFGKNTTKQKKSYGKKINKELNILEKEMRLSQKILQATMAGRSKKHLI